MLVSYNWLSEYVDISDISPQTLAEKITKAGIEVEHVHFMNKGVQGVVVGYIQECRPHPDANKLNLCDVDVGGDVVQIVCGAPNVAAGQKVAVAKPGAVLPGDMKIKKTKLRGETSNGMICSLQELGINEALVPKAFTDGIYVLEGEAKVGDDITSYLNLDDVVLELDILPNSAHAFNMIGTAYEVAAILDRDVRLPQPKVQVSSSQTADKVKVTVHADQHVPYYGARVVEQVQIKPSPQWLQNKLIASGIRPHNNIVDITNYVLLEYGQPLHAFDYDRLGSQEIVVRHAIENETMTTLDEQERLLQTNDLVVTNGESPVAIAGVMGGAGSEVTDMTRNILLESAVFDGASVRRTATRLQLRTDASQHYEKGLDRNRVVPAAERAVQLMHELANAEVLDGIVASGEAEVEPGIINMPWQKVNDVLGLDLSVDNIQSVLERLRFGIEIKGESMRVEVPVRRPDVSIPEDIVEEVGRIFGYDDVPATLPEGASTQGQLTFYQKGRRNIRRFMESAGLNQAITYSLTTAEKADQFVFFDDESSYPLHLSMPMSADRGVLRKSLIPNLLEVVQYHSNRQMDDVTLYEIGAVFLSPEQSLEHLPNEKEKLAGVLTGKDSQTSWQEKGQPVDFFTGKGILEGLFDILGVRDRVTFVQSTHKGMHPGRTADILFAGTPIGVIGQIHPTVEKELDIHETYVFELDIEKVLHQEAPALTYETLPRFPAINRDIALVVDEDVSAGRLEQVIWEHGSSLLKDVRLFDVYQGEHIEASKKSLAFSLKYYDPERTLTDDEVSQVHDRILEQLNETTGAVLRG
ncbi:phenylalanine--tRNA ligase subunit beta [Tuberibacillus sp. Marseille-P3662]|uniref:phenylalanine--tRNA ligase subunit beta n=1 Tax=Tuberibacillus sp. Marseille-P3662 TaxID=1965358 RepID=UPI000A1C8279|nr:phenylalanine--tRNA ligase subunit beta [Tuberibacillus sp. Marseille-P3662]